MIYYSYVLNGKKVDLIDLFALVSNLFTYLFNKIIFSYLYREAYVQVVLNLFQIR